MDFSSLVLMEKEKGTGFITKELGSFQVSDGALHVRKLFAQDGIVSLYFDTNKETEEWEYSAIYDLFNKDAFIEKGYTIEDELDEYDPTFVINFAYEDDYEPMKIKINECVNLIETEMQNVYIAIEGKEAEYQE